MRRYWVKEDSFGEGKVTLRGEDFHHICEVCRRQIGHRFEVLRKGEAFLVELVARKKKEAEARIIERRPLPSLKPPFIHLALSVPRFSTMDKVVEKSVELGVYEVCPFFSDYSFVKDLKKIGGSRQKRWEKIVRSATEQTGRADLMPIQPPVSLEVLLDQINPSQGILGLFFYEGQGGMDLRQALEKVKEVSLKKDVYLFIGGEGGFSQREVSLLGQKGLEPISLGDQVLRVETACTATIAIIKYELGLI
ncbi:MAG: 16S rRNA (uracil(1498)-N(3))-methyltransferase [Bdellovibrio sp.]|nr:MAG: 16S rRNA (uracil(1498)-N(3))-methyltransferase [Bdellovibrio sp.]